MLIVLDYIKFKFSLSADSATSYHHCVAALSAISIIIINNIMLSADYNYLLTENVLSTINKLKMTVKILCCQAEKLNVDAFIALLASLSHLCQLHSHSSLCHCSEQ